MAFLFQFWMQSVYVCVPFTAYNRLYQNLIIFPFAGYLCVCVCKSVFSVHIYYDGSVLWRLWLLPINTLCFLAKHSLFVFFFGSPFLLYSHFGYPLISFIPTYSIMIHRSFVSKRGVCFRIPNRSIQCSMTELKCQIPKIPYAAREYPIHLKFCNGLKHEIRFIFIIP